MIKLGLQDWLVLGNLDAYLVWDYAPDYVNAMWLMLQGDTPDDFVVAAGETRSVRDFAQAAFSSVGLAYEKYVTIDTNLFRPTEKVLLTGDPSKIIDRYGWKPTYQSTEIIAEMIECEMWLHQRS